MNESERNTNLSLAWAFFASAICWSFYRFTLPKLQVGCPQEKSLLKRYGSLNNLLALWLVVSGLVHVPPVQRLVEGKHQGQIELLKDRASTLESHELLFFVFLMSWTISLQILLVFSLASVVGHTVGYKVPVRDFQKTTQHVQRTCAFSLGVCLVGGFLRGFILEESLDPWLPALRFLSEQEVKYDLPFEMLLIATSCLTLVATFAISALFSKHTVGTMSDAEEPNGFLPMIEWFSLNMLPVTFLNIQNALFENRFDVRSFQKELGHRRTPTSGQGPETMKQSMTFEPCPVDADYSNKQEFCFDWVADTGDGGNSTYAVARCLAETTLKVKVPSQNNYFPDERCGSRVSDKQAISLTRAEVLIVGGDLCYPWSSLQIYRDRLYNIYDLALRCPERNGLRISTRKTSFSQGIASSDSTSEKDSALEEQIRAAPICFCMTGNHDWLDGLVTFTQCNLNSDWLGGWFLPQTRSYFALKLPHDWWFFGLDYALENDIDVAQYQYFAAIGNQLSKQDKVIVATHIPSWLLNAYDNITTQGRRLQDLINHDIKGVVEIHIAGDIHNYMRYEKVSSVKASQSKLSPHECAKKSAAQRLIVSGGGGAFTHATHTFPAAVEDNDSQYVRQIAFPDCGTSKRLSLLNLTLEVVNRNRALGPFLGTVYFAWFLEHFPFCHAAVLDPATLSISLLPTIAYDLLYKVVTEGTFSLLFTAGVLLVCMGISEPKLGPAAVVFWGLFHSLLHLAAAIILCIGTELLQSLAHQHTSGTHATNHSLDVLQYLSDYHLLLCSNPESSSTLSRLDRFLYYAGSYGYMLLFSADLATFTFSCYLAVTCCFAGLHWNEAFATLRDENHKSFLRFKIDAAGNLECFGIGLPRTPTKWKPSSSSSSSSISISESREPPASNMEANTHLNGRQAHHRSNGHSIATSKPYYESGTEDKYLRALEEPVLIDYFSVKKGQ